MSGFERTTGLERLETMLETADLGPMMKLMGHKIVSVAPGSAVVSVEPLETFENSMRRMHGGFVCTLIDSALGCAVFTVLEVGTMFGTIDLNVKFVRKIDTTTGTLHATATVVHGGRTMITAEARVTDMQGKIYAHGSGTFLVYPKQ